MKAISLWQPWASAIALGKKSIETRHWPTTYRLELAIHAAKRPLEQCVDRDAWLGLQSLLGRDPRDLPRGCIVATALIVECTPTERLDPSDEERQWGDYSDGRFGWVLTRVRPLATPLPVRGQQGLWDLTADEERQVLARLAA